MNEYVYTKVLHDEMQAVISNLEAREWIQGTEVDGDKVCAHGAVKTCEVLRPGDEQIIRAVMRTRGVTEEWNDKNGRTKAEVLARMRQIEVSDADLEATFGPNWRQVIAVIRRAAIITSDEVQQLAAAWSATWDAAWSAARDAAWTAAWTAAWSAARTAAWKYALAAVWHAVWHAARDAARAVTWSATQDAAMADARVATRNSARDAAVAVVVADLAGQHGLTQDHIYTLMKTWIDVLGEDWAAKNA